MKDRDIRVAFRGCQRAAEARPGSERWTLERYAMLFKPVPAGKARQDGRCQYCLGDVWITAGYHVDRIDSSQGYTWSNCVPCCAVCNRIKNALPPALFMIVIESLARQWPGGIPWPSIMGRDHGFRFLESGFPETERYEIRGLQQELIPTREGP